MKRRLIALRFNGGGDRAGPKGWKKVCKLMAPGKTRQHAFHGDAMKACYADPSIR
jgi:hypothetical protein